MLIMCFEMEIQIAMIPYYLLADWREELEDSMASQTIYAHAFNFLNFLLFYSEII